MAFGSGRMRVGTLDAIHQVIIHKEHWLMPRALSAGYWLDNLTFGNSGVIGGGGGGVRIFGLPFL